MKFGKRRERAQVPGVPGVTIPGAGSESRGRKQDDSDAVSASAPAPGASPVTDSWTGAPGASTGGDRAAAPAEPLGYAEPVVEGEAVELPPVEPAAPAYEPPVPLTMQSDPVSPPGASRPVGAVEAGGTVSGGASAASLGDAGDTFASGHAAAPGPSWQEPLMELADERPELVVAAAFAGGVLAAMILRRLGN